MDRREELFPGVTGYSEVDPTGILHIADIVSSDPDKGDASRYLDSLTTGKEVRVHDVINPQLEAMLAKRGFVVSNGYSHLYAKECVIYRRYPAAEIPAFDQITAILNAATHHETPIPPTLLYNENWLMRLVLSLAVEGIPCLPFPLEPGARWFSEARLRTPFCKRSQSDNKGEPATHADGVVGHFSFETDTKASLKLNPDGSQFVVLEGKIFSKLRKNVKNAESYDQAARIVGCMAESLCRSGKLPEKWKSLGFYLFAPQSQIDGGIFRSAMHADSIKRAIRGRMNSYECEDPDDMGQWETLWFEPLLARLKIKCVSWEAIIEEVKRHHSLAGIQLERFYIRTLEFNRTKNKEPACRPGRGKGVKEASFVYVPQLTKAERTVLHLSIRGGSYRLRRYDLRSPQKKPCLCPAPGCATAEQLKASGALVREFPVTRADMTHNLDKEPEYWCKRIEEVNAECFAAADIP